MTDETKGDGMTLEQVRDKLRAAGRFVIYQPNGTEALWAEELANAIDAHLSRLMTVSDESVRISVNARDDAWNSESTEETLMHAALESFSMYQLGQLPNISKESHLAAQSAMRASVSKEAKADLIACDWLEGNLFWVNDDPGEHDPCYLVMPDNSCLVLNHHAVNGIDQARAQFIADCCNQVLSPIQQPIDQSAMRVDDTGDVEDMVSKALRRAWQLGQTYWQQADSESWSQNKKADETQAKFDKLVDETRAALQAAVGKPQP